MSTDLIQLKADLKRVRKEIELIQAKIRIIEQQQRDEVPPFAKLLGVWKGANFTEEEIAAAKIKVKESPE